MSFIDPKTFNVVYKSCPSFWFNYAKSCCWLKDQGFTPVNCPIKFPTSDGNSQDLITNSHSTVKFKYDEQQDQEDQEEEEEEEEYENTDSTATDSTDSESLVDSNYIQFILETRKHQKEQERLKAVRIKMEESEQIIYKDICEIDVQKLIGSSTGQEPGRSDSDYRHLYGMESETIKAKEALLQSDFNVYCDSQKPNFWPTIPIRI